MGFVTKEALLDELEAAIVGGLVVDKSKVVRTRLEVDSIGATVTITMFLSKEDISNLLKELN